MSVYLILWRTTFVHDRVAISFAACAGWM